MANVVGKSGDFVLLSNGDNGVVVDTEFNLVTETGDVRELTASRDWSMAPVEVSNSVLDLADGALTSLDIKIVASAGRMYTIPKGVQNEAKKALEWRKEEDRGGTPVGLNTARTLAEGGQIGIEKVRHIAKYFPRHEVDKQGKGWKPEQDGFPSNGRIAWALWGGDTGWRWAQAIVERENKKAITADGYAMPGYQPEYDEQPSSYDSDVDAFKSAYEFDETAAPEFVARVRLDGSGIDRLYKIDLDGSVYVWDGSAWEDLGHVDHDIYTYDRALDDAYDTVPKDHIVIDAGSAILISARMQQQPFKCVSVGELDADEALMVADAIGDEDWDTVDRVIIAAGDSFTDPEAPATDDGYTPEERAENARRQVRDATGKFAAQGSRVIVGGDQNKVGAITKVNPDTQSVTIAFDDGTTGDVPADQTQSVESYVSAYVPDTTDLAPLDTSGILGQPRTPIDRPNARIPGTLPALTSEDLQRVMYDWPAWVSDQRASYEANPAKKYSKPEAEKVARDARTPNDKSEAKDQAGATTAKNVDAYQHPLLQEWLKRSTSSRGVTSPNSMWYQPVISSGEPEAEMTPENSDVQPLYVAIVSPDDPRAVLDLASIVPASASSNMPMAYKRVKGAWVRDEGILNDLNSATPPPVIPLDSVTLDSVLMQVDGLEPIAAGGAMMIDHILMVLWGPKPETIERAPGYYDDVFLEDTDEEYDSYEDGWDDIFSIIAAGGADRNRGNAERLRRYWTKGKGAAKIRWGQPGDWKRCVRYLGKYMGARAKGYCQLRHKDALGYYTSTHAAKDRGRGNFAIGHPGEDGDDLAILIDMDMPIVEIYKENDDLFDAHWEIPTPIAQVLEALADLEEEDYALIAAGGPNPNRNRGAAKLRKYWTIGKGGAKIRWNTGGDWTRCVRYLSKYMGPRAKGYCALRHHEMTGLWTGDQKHIQMYGRKGKGRNMFSTDVITASADVIEKAILNARMNDARDRMGLTAGGTADCGAKFHIPLVIPEEHESGDGRKFAKDAIDIRELPLPLLWQIKTADGHMGSVVVGRIDTMEKTDEGIGNAYGVFDTGAYGKEAERLVRHGFIRGVSADMDKFEAEEVVAEIEGDDGEKVEKQKLHISQARVMAVTIVPKPAFQECKILIIDDEANEEETVIPDGVYVEDVDPIEAAALVASGLIAGAIPVVPPAQWFENQKLQKATPLTVTDDGQVYGHIAAWHVDHIGMAFGTKPPRSRSKYAYFHTGVVRTDSGKDFPVGQLTLAGGHAPLEANAVAAARHYDDTASAIADVHAGEDAYGIWVAGALRPGASPEQVRALRASAPSGDWRPIKGGLELVAVCQVNVPGFPIARARVASGQVMALVAAGANSLARMKSDPFADLTERIARMEQRTFAANADDVRARFNSIKAELPVTEAIIADGAYEVNENTYVEEQPSLLAPELKKLLASVYSLSTRAQGYHWNVKGADFAQYHALFGEIYSDVHSSIDPLAENILKLDQDSPFNLSEFSAMSMLAESDIDTATTLGMAYDLYSANELIIALLKGAFETADHCNEQGVADFIAGRIDAHQKWRWQLRASVTPEQLQVLENQASEPVVSEYYEQVFSAVTAGGSAAVLEQLESAQLSIKAEYAKSRFADIREARAAELSARMDELASKVFGTVEFEDGFGYVPMRERRKLAKEGKAMEDGSFPITNIDSLKDSIQSYGRAKPSRRAAVRRHIVKRARQLKQADLIPEEWKALSSPSKKVQELANQRIDAMEAAAEAESLGKA